MVKEKFKSSAAGFTGILSALTAAAVLSFSVAGCGLVAMGITESLGSPDLKKISNAKEIGYAVTFRTPAVASDVTAEETAAARKNGTTFTMLTTQKYIILDIVRKNNNRVSRKMRVIEYPDKDLYALELSVPAEKNTHKRYAYAFPDEYTLSQAVGFADFYSLRGLSNYLISVKDKDCTGPSGKTYRELELISACKGNGFRYKVESFINFDHGFIFPKYFSYMGPASESHYFEVDGVRNVNSDKVRASSKLMNEVNRDFSQKLARGLAKRADASDIRTIRKLVEDK